MPTETVAKNVVVCNYNKDAGEKKTPEDLKVSDGDKDGEYTVAQYTGANFKCLNAKALLVSATAFIAAALVM